LIIKQEDQVEHDVHGITASQYALTCGTLWQ
jgi:hypothetical protein